SASTSLKGSRSPSPGRSAWWFEGREKEMIPTGVTHTAMKRARAAALLACLLAAAPAFGQTKTVLRISTPAVPEDWHVKMLYVFRDELNRAAPGRFDVQVHHSGTLFRQGAEAVAMQRGNLEMALLSMQDIARQIPEYSIFTAGYLIRDPDHLAKVYGGPIGEEAGRRIAAAMDIQLLQAVYLGTRQVSLAQPRRVRTPADLAGVKLRMPGPKAAKFNDENRVREEKELIEFFRAQGIEITTPDVEAFRKTVQAAYLNSEYAEKWPRGLLERINAVK